MESIVDSEKTKTCIGVENTQFCKHQQGKHDPGQNYCYGSDEEQTRTATVDAAEQKYHTHRLLQNERERDERKNTQTNLRGSL